MPSHNYLTVREERLRRHREDALEPKLPVVDLRAKRSSLLPGVSSAKQAGLPRVAMDVWVGFSAPASTPRPAIDKLNKAIIDALSLPDGRKRLTEQGPQPVPNKPAQASQLVAAEMQRWGTVVKAAGIEVD